MLALTCLVGLVQFVSGYSYEKGRQAAGYYEAPEIAALSQPSDFLGTLDPVDASIWTNMRGLARVCDNCSALAEFEHGKRLPIVVSHMDRGSNVGYTMVLGIVNYEGHRPLVVPVMRYYVGTQGGSRLRIDEQGQASVLRGLTWDRVSYPNHPEIIGEIRRALVRERLLWIR